MMGLDFLRGDAVLYEFSLERAQADAQNCGTLSAVAAGVCKRI